MARNGLDCDISQTRVGGIVDGGHNLDSDGSCGFSAGNHSLSNVDPGFSPTGLDFYGGRTQVIALSATSPAVDAGDDTVCTGDLVNSRDQRGLPRPQGTHCDIGAFELLIPVVTASDATARNTDDSVQLSASVTFNCGALFQACPETADGTITFSVTDSANNAVGSPVSGTLTGGTATAMFNLPDLAPGTYTITATYHDATETYLDSTDTSTLTITVLSTPRASLMIVSLFGARTQAMVFTGQDGPPIGFLGYIDHSVHLRNVQLTSMVVDGPQATLRGTATLDDGSTVSFRLDATGRRFFGGTLRLHLSNGYDSGPVHALLVFIRS